MACVGGLAVPLALGTALTLDSGTSSVVVFEPSLAGASAEAEGDEGEEEERADDDDGDLCAFGSLVLVRFRAW